MIGFDINKENDYWNKYWAKNTNPFEPSLFAKFILAYLKPDVQLCELGCGNGRDAVFFNANGIEVDAYDLAAEEIAFLNNTHSNSKLHFWVGDFSKLPISQNKYDAVYSRFTIHSVTEQQENAVLDWVCSALKDGGILFVESRSVNDPLLQTGEKLSAQENFTDHYRRYMDAKKFKAKLLARGFKIAYMEESDQFAPYNGETPMIVRVIARKD